MIKAESPLVTGVSDNKKYKVRSDKTKAHKKFLFTKNFFIKNIILS